MRKNIIFTIIFAMLMTMTTAYAAEVPKEAVPFYADNESVVIPVPLTNLLSLGNSKFCSKRTWLW